MFTSPELAREIQACAAGEVCLGEFDDWFEGASCNVHQGGGRSLIDAAFRIEAVFSALGGGRLSEDEAKQELVRALNAPTVIGTC